MHANRVTLVLFSLATFGALASCASTGVQLTRAIPIALSEASGEEVSACASGYLIDDTVVVHLLVVNRSADRIRLNPVELTATGITPDGTRVVRVWEPGAFTAAHTSGARYPVATELPATQPTDSKGTDTLAEILERKSQAQRLPLLRPISIPPGHYVLASLVLERANVAEYHLSLPHFDEDLRLVPESSVERSAG